MSTEQTAAESGALSLDGFVAELDKPAAVAEAEEEVETEGEAGAEAEPAEAQEETEAEADEELEATEEEEVEEEEAERLPPPQSWAADDHDAWNTLTPAAQAVVLKREADRDRAVADAAAKAGRAAAEVKTLAQDYEKVASQVTDEVTRATEDWKARWGNVDWVRHARDNPDAYIADKAQADAEREQIIAYAQHLEDVKAKAAKASELARTAFLAEELTKLAELSPELADPKEGSARRKEVGEYLAAQGIPMDALADISAVELSLARKAMLWDNAQKAAKAQAAIPRKNPTSTVKPVPSGGGQGVASPKREVAAANARLSKDKSVNALVALFDAEDAAKTRKAVR